MRLYVRPLWLAYTHAYAYHIIMPTTYLVSKKKKNKIFYISSPTLASNGLLLAVKNWPVNSRRMYTSLVVDHKARGIVLYVTIFLAHPVPHVSLSPPFPFLYLSPEASFRYHDHHFYSQKYRVFSQKLPPS